MGDWKIGRSKRALFSWLLEVSPESVASYRFQQPSAAPGHLLAPALLPTLAGQPEQAAASGGCSGGTVGTSTVAASQRFREEYTPGIC